MAFLRLFEFALIFWIPLFILLYHIKQWNLTVAQKVGAIILAGSAAAAVTAGIITLIVLFG